MPQQASTATPASARRVIRQSALPEIVGVSTSTINRLRRAGDFPQPFTISKQAVGFDIVEIEAWIEARKASRQKGIA